MKRIVTVLLVALISVLSTPGVQAAPTPPPPQVAPHFDGLPGVVLFASVNIRRAPRVTSSIVGRLALGEQITVLGRTLASVWVLVRSSSGVTGWVARQYIRFDGVVRDLPVSDVYPPFLTVVGVPSVNVRIGPGELYPIITRLPFGVEADVLATFRRTSWYEIAMPDNGPIGWVRSDNVLVDSLPESLPDLPREPVLAFVTSYRVKVRSDAKLTAPVIGVIRLAQAYEVVGTDARGNWWLIQGPFGTGWVLGAYVKVYGDWGNLPEYQTEPIR